MTCKHETTKLEIKLKYSDGLSVAIETCTDCGMIRPVLVDDSLEIVADQDWIPQIGHGGGKTMLGHAFNKAVKQASWRRNATANRLFR